MCGRTAAGCVRRVVGRGDPLPLVDLRRSALVCVGIGLSRVGVPPWGCRWGPVGFRVGLAMQQACGGDRSGELMRCDSCRFCLAFALPGPLPRSGLLGSLVRPPSGRGLVAGDGHLLCRRRRSSLCRSPPSPVLPPRRQAGGRSAVVSEGAPAPRLCGRVLCGLGGRERKGCPARRMGKRRLVVIVPPVVAVCRPRCVSGGARPAPSSVGNACVGACWGAKVGTRAVRLTPAHVSR